MRELKRIIAVAIVVIMLLPMSAFAVSDRLHDGAGLLPEDEATVLADMLDSYSDDTGIYVGVVTVASIGDQPVDQYADRYYHDNGMGAGENRDGVVAFVAMASRDIYIYTYGERAMAIYDDARIETMLDDMVDPLGDERYLEAFTAFATDAQMYESEGIKDDQYTQNTETGVIEPQYRDPEPQYRDPEPLVDPMWVLASFGISLGVAAVACAGVVGKYKLIFVPDSYPFREKGRLTLTRSEDTFLYKRMTSRVIESNSGSGGSRSSSSSSVGGGSHGGGGRKF